MVPVIVISVIILVVASFSVWQTNRNNNLILQEIKRFAKKLDYRVEQIKRPRNGDTGPFHDTVQEINSKIISNSIGNNSRRWLYRVVSYIDDNNKSHFYWFRGKRSNNKEKRMDVEWKKVEK